MGMSEQIEQTTLRIASLPGDGIGPEVNAEALKVLSAAVEAEGVKLDVAEQLIGGNAIDATGSPLPERTLDAVRSADAVLLGAVGGPKWDDSEVRPEAGLLALRRELGVFANLRPVAVPAGAEGASPLRPGVVAGTDMLIVRELTGGIYFGEPAGISEENGIRTGINTMRYDEEEIRRVARVAFRQAEQRRGHVTSVDKANVLAVSRLWREVVTAVHVEEFPHVTLEHLYVDNAAMQLVRRPTDFDVVVTGNLFGDILSDLAATLPGSLGMLPSASVGGRAGLFEPVHGSAPDIAGSGRANPCAAILSAAMLLDDIGRPQLGNVVRESVASVLAEGLSTPDVGGKLTTSELGDAIAERVIARLSEVAA